MREEFRRKAPRRRFNGQIGVLYKGRMTITQCSQLGEGGALISSDHLLDAVEKGDSMVVTAFLPNIGGLVAAAQCVYRNDSGNIGLQFEVLETKYKVKVREFVSRRKSLEVS